MESDEDFSSDVSDELMLSTNSKRPKNFIFTSSEEEEENSSVISSITLSSSESEDEKEDCGIDDAKWSEPIGNQPRLVPFAGKTGLKAVGDNCEKVEDFYLLLVTEEMFEKIAEHTNLHAARVLSEKQSKRLEKWTPTDKNEIKRFFGLIMWMGLVQLPRIHLYWSKDPAYVQTFARDTMSRNRFELLLRVLYFTRNEELSPSDHLRKIKEVVDELNKNYQKYYDPGEMLYVDESFAAFHYGQFAQQKVHKYSPRIFRLYSAPGYTISFQVFYGKKSDVQTSNRTNIVLSLCQNILGKGHTICTDNRSTSIDLAKQLIAVNTHLVGMIRPNRHGISKEVVSKRLVRGKLFAKEHKDGITLLKWKNKQKVLLLSSKHSVESVTVKKRGHICTKPKAVVDYNEAEAFTNRSDQIAEYIHPLRRSVKWYKKLLLELLLNTSVINAWIMYKTKDNSLSVVKFIEQLILYLTRCREKPPGDDSLSSTTSSVEKKRHEMNKKQGKQSSIRRRCTLCYTKNVQKFGTQLARNSTVKVVTYCNDCPGKPHLCLPCFNTKHRDMPL